MRSPLDLFFKLGDKVTKGDMKRKADFDYYFLWLIFLAFCFVLYGNARNYIVTHQFQYLGWSLVMVGILWFQYYTLKSVREVRQLQKELTAKVVKIEPKEENNDSPQEMMEGFNDEKDKKKDK